jgi:hypothetical protein
VRYLRRGGLLKLLEYGRKNLYFLADPVRGLIKIGVADDVDRRLRQIRAGGLAIGLISSGPGNAHLERVLHWAFRHSQADGEWFYPTPGLVRLAYRFAQAGIESQKLRVLCGFLGCSVDGVRWPSRHRHDRPPLFPDLRRRLE